MLGFYAIWKLYTIDPPQATKCDWNNNKTLQYLSLQREITSATCIYLLMAPCPYRSSEKSYSERFANVNVRHMELFHSPAFFPPILIHPLNGSIVSATLSNLVKTATATKKFFPCSACCSYYKDSLRMELCALFCLWQE